MSQRQGHGTTLAFATSAFACIIKDVTPPGATRADIDTTHYATSVFKTFTPSDLVEWGEASFSIAFEPGTLPPITQPIEVVTITFPDGTKWTFNGYVKGYAPKAPQEEVMTADIVIKVSGAVVVS